MHPLCFAGLSLVLFIFSSLERSTHDAGTVQSSDLRTLRRKFKKNPQLQCLGRSQNDQARQGRPFRGI